MEPTQKAFCALIKKRRPVNVLPCYIGDIPCNMMKSCKVIMANRVAIGQAELARAQDLEKELKQIEAEVAAEQAKKLAVASQEIGFIPRPNEHGQ